MCERVIVVWKWRRGRKPEPVLAVLYTCHVDKRRARRQTRRGRDPLGDLQPRLLAYLSHQKFIYFLSAHDIASIAAIAEHLGTFIPVF